MVTSGRRPRPVSLGRQQCPVRLCRSPGMNAATKQKMRKEEGRRREVWRLLNDFIGRRRTRTDGRPPNEETDGRRDTACPIYCLGRLGMGRRNCARAYI